LFGVISKWLEGGEEEQKIRACEKLLDRRNVLILDTETTGLDEKDEIVEIGIINTRNKKRYHALVLPTCRIAASFAVRTPCLRLRAGEVRNAAD